MSHGCISVPRVAKPGSSWLEDSGWDLDLVVANRRGRGLRGAACRPARIGGQTGVGAHHIFRWQTTRLLELGGRRTDGGGGPRERDLAWGLLTMLGGGART